MAQDSYTVEVWADGSITSEAGDTLELKDFSTDKRDKLAKSGKALPDGSFPIENVSDLHNAIQAIGRAKNPAQAKDHIIKRAKALGAEGELPEGWGTTASAELHARLDVIEMAVVGLATMEFYSPDQERDGHGRWGGGGGVPQVSPAAKKLREPEPGKVEVHVGKLIEKAPKHVNPVDKKEPGRVVVNVGRSYAPTKDGGTIHKADAAAKMHGAGSKQHLDAIKRFGPGTVSA